MVTLFLCYAMLCARGNPCVEAPVLVASRVISPAWVAQVVASPPQHVHRNDVLLILLWLPLVAKSGVLAYGRDETNHRHWATTQRTSLMAAAMDAATLTYSKRCPANSLEE